MPLIDGKVLGREAVTQYMEGVTPRVRTALETKITQLAIKLQAHVVSDKLQGQVLNVRTGRLQRSISQTVISDDQQITGLVSTAVKYAAPHEYGLDKTVNVKEHLRTIKEAFGKSLKEPVTFTVREHEMHMHFPPRSFLRTALEEMNDEVRKGIADAVHEGLTK